MPGSSDHSAWRNMGSALDGGVEVRTTSDTDTPSPPGHVQVRTRRFADRSHLVIARDADDLAWACSEAVHR